MRREAKTAKEMEAETPSLETNSKPVASLSPHSIEKRIASAELAIEMETPLCIPISKDTPSSSYSMENNVSDLGSGYVHLPALVQITLNSFE